MGPSGLGPAETPRSTGVPPLGRALAARALGLYAAANGGEPGRKDATRAAKPLEADDAPPGVPAMLMCERA
jgi:hypothetical protein